MILICKVGPDDFDLIWPLLRDAFRAGDTYAVDPDISMDDARDLWLRQARATYLAKSDNKVVGTYYIRTNKPGGGAHICNCGYIVSPAVRGQGIATQLCEHSQDEARGLGYRAMQFNFVLASNVGAVRLWHRLGFETVGTIPDAFVHPVQGDVDAYVMYRRL